MANVEEAATKDDKTKLQKFLNRTNDFIKQTVPIIDWLPKYNFKEYIIPDALAGFTVACVVVPQALAFAVLANVPLVYGLYTACFAPFIYTFFGTATISSFGPVAIGSMLTGEATNAIVTENSPYTKEQFVATLTVFIGLTYIIGYLIRFGCLTVVFKKAFVSGFIFACILHVFVKTIRSILGLNIVSVYGYFNIYYNTKNVIQHIHLTHVPTLLISAVVLFIFAFNILFLKAFIAKFTKVIFPVEAFVLFFAILFSYLFKFKDMGVSIVGFVPSGFPKFEPPVTSAIADVIIPAFQISVVNYATTVSMTKLFNKDIRPSQELLALGITNTICGNFQCIIIGNSMMRTIVAINLGIKSMIATMVASILLFFITLFAGPLFEPLPQCCLGCIIITAATIMIVQTMRDLPKFFKNYEDLIIWTVTLLVTLFLDILLGLVAGLTLELRRILSQVERAEKMVVPTESDTKNEKEVKTLLNS